MSTSTGVVEAVGQESETSMEAKRTVAVPCRLGLHLRVAALVVMMARQFQSEISFAAGRRRVDAKSIFGLLRLGAVRGKRLSLIAHGPDAPRAVQVLAELFESKEILCKENVTGEEVSYGHA
jgi:phosphotransferase system HPr (HPr) family protein